MKNDNLKEIILYVLASTGAVLFFLAAFVMFRENNFIFAGTILQIIGANIVITLGLSLTHKIEFRYVVLEYLLDIGFMTAVIVLAGTIFKWYFSIPVWVPLVIVFAVYVLFYLLDIVRVRRDVKEINKLLQKLREKESNTEVV
jgi:nitrate/nitrite transporter NarK